MAFEADHGMKKVAILVEHVLARVQTQRLAKQQGLEGDSFRQKKRLFVG
jgi:hypothetical protein